MFRVDMKGEGGRIRLVVVVTELGRMSPGDRWHRLLAPLEEQLAESGLGRILDFDTLRGETDRLGYCSAEEVTVELAHWDYGRELVAGVVAASGVPSGDPVMPKRWSGYRYEDDFAEGWFRRGHFDEPSQTLVVVPLSEIYEDADRQILVVGGPGVDSVDFVYRNGLNGLWAYYRHDDEFVFVAATVAELVERWRSGKLAV